METGATALLPCSATGGTSATIATSKLYRHYTALVPLYIFTDPIVSCSAADADTAAHTHGHTGIGGGRSTAPTPSSRPPAAPNLRGASGTVQYGGPLPYSRLTAAGESRKNSHTSKRWGSGGSGTPPPPLPQPLTPPSDSAADGDRSRWPPPYPRSADASKDLFPSCARSTVQIPAPTSAPRHPSTFPTAGASSAPFTSPHTS